MRILLAVLLTPITLLLDLASLQAMSGFFELTRGLWKWIQREKGKTFLQSMAALRTKLFTDETTPLFAQPPMYHSLMGLASTGAVVLVFARVSAGWAIPREFWWIVLVLLMFATLAIVEQVQFRVHRRRVVKHVHSSDFTACLTCGYALRGLPKQHTCPECGRAYELENVWKTWLTWFDQK